MIYPYKDILNIFKEKKEINKISFVHSNSGFCWTNFWWARGFIIASCKQPKIVTSIEDRFYYEGWLST